MIMATIIFSMWFLTVLRAVNCHARSSFLRVPLLLARSICCGASEGQVARAFAWPELSLHHHRAARGSLSPVQQDSTTARDHRSGRTMSSSYARQSGSSSGAGSGVGPIRSLKRTFSSGGTTTTLGVGASIAKKSLPASAYGVCVLSCGVILLAWADLGTRALGLCRRALYRAPRLRLC